MNNIEELLKNIQNSLQITGILNYYYDEQDPLKPFATIVQANKGSLPPRNATRIQPDFKEGLVPCWNGEEWINRIDNREKTVYSIETGEAVFNYSIDVLPGHTLVPPTTEYDVWVGDKWVTDEDKRIASELDKRKRERWLYLYEAGQQIDQLNEIIEILEDDRKEEYQNHLKEWKQYRAKLNLLDFNSKDFTFPKEPDFKLN